MTVRTSQAEVEKIIDVDDEGLTDFDPFITAANSLVTEVCVPKGYTEARLTLIETWLAAHFVAVRNPRTASEGAGGVSTSFEGQTGFGFAGTKYGQMAMRLDTLGGLAALDQQAQKGAIKPTMSWLGSELT